MLVLLPFEVMKTERFISDSATYYTSYSPTTYSLHEEGVGRGGEKSALTSSLPTCRKKQCQITQ